MYRDSAVCLDRKEAEMTIFWIGATITGSLQFYISKSVIYYSEKTGVSN